MEHSAAVVLQHVNGPQFRGVRAGLWKPITHASGDGTMRWDVNGRLAQPSPYFRIGQNRLRPNRGQGGIQICGAIRSDSVFAYKRARTWTIGRLSLWYGGWALRVEECSPFSY